MGELLHELGIDWRLLIASLVNFALLFFILKKYAYKPILGMLEKREKMVADSVDQSQKIEQEFRALQERKEQELRGARAEATKIIEEAARKADELKHELVRDAKAEAKKLVAQTKAELVAEREALKASVRDEVADLVVDATEKVLGEKLTAAADRKLVERSLSSVETLPAGRQERV
ncbi:MAG: F0F1 ATP synthase subunit B [Candidatus Kerfeldbacteria bacterium]|nr:F0F1 ATP synthase subunit B [Candidatus Kerfeldbacteria bacterium]